MKRWSSRSRTQGQGSVPVHHGNGRYFLRQSEVAGAVQEARATQVRGAVAQRAARNGETWRLSLAGACKHSSCGPSTAADVEHGSHASGGEHGQVIRARGRRGPTASPQEPQQLNTSCLSYLHRHVRRLKQASDLSPGPMTRGKPGLPECHRSHAKYRTFTPVGSNRTARPRATTRPGVRG
jgi:hypothetical protein